MKSTLSNRKLPARDVFFFRQRFKNKVFQSVLLYFTDLAKEKGLAKRDIANLLDKDPSQITRWFSGPNNWTLDTISDLLLAMDAELKHEILPLNEVNHQKARTENHTEQSETQSDLMLQAKSPSVDSALDKFPSATLFSSRIHLKVSNDPVKQGGASRHMKNITECGRHTPQNMISPSGSSCEIQANQMH